VSKYQEHVERKKNSSDWDDFKERRKKSNLKWRTNNKKKYNDYINNWKKQHLNRADTTN